MGFYTRSHLVFVQGTLFCRHLQNGKHNRRGWQDVYLCVGRYHQGNGAHQEETGLVQTTFEKDAAVWYTI